MKYWILTLMLTLIAPSAFAEADGTETGNGGDALVCYDANDNIESVRLLDFYEAIEKNRIKRIELGESKGKKTYDQKVHYALDRLAKLNPTRANKYRKWYSTFFSDEEFKWGGKLPNIPDTGPLDYPENCEVEQIAIHAKPELPGDKRYTIRKKLWNHLNTDHKAGLILHELVYREAKEQRVTYQINPRYRTVNVAEFHADSKKVRHFTATISSDQFNNMSLKQYIELAQLVRLQIIDINKVPVISFWAEQDRENPGAIIVKYPEIIFFSPDTVKSHSLIKDSHSYYNPRNRKVGCIKTTYANRIGCASQYRGSRRHDIENVISFYENGILKSGFYVFNKSENVVITEHVTGKISEYDRTRKTPIYAELYFDENQKVIKARLDSWNSSASARSIQDYEDHDDRLSKFIFRAPNYDPNSYKLHLSSDLQLYFNASGYVIQWSSDVPILNVIAENGSFRLSNPRFDESGNLLSAHTHVWRRYSFGTQHKIETAIYVKAESRDLQQLSFAATVKGSRRNVLEKAATEAKVQCQSHIDSTVPKQHQNAFQCSVNEDKCYSSGWLSKKTHCTARIKIVSTESVE